MSGLAARRDDYLEFCEGVRLLTGIDLANSTERPQMERRIRSFAESRGATSLPGYLRSLSDDRAELDSFLDRMTINVSQLLAQSGAVGPPGDQRSSRAGGDRPDPLLERRMLLRRRGLHPGGAVPQHGASRPRRGAWHRHRCPHGRAGPGGRVHRGRRPHRAAGRAEALVRADHRWRLAAKASCGC